MTTEYRDKAGKLLRTDHGTQPRGTTPPATPAPTTDAAAPAPAKKEK